MQQSGLNKQINKALKAYLDLYLAFIKMFLCKMVISRNGKLMYISLMYKLGREKGITILRCIFNNTFVIPTLLLMILKFLC